MKFIDYLSRYRIPLKDGAQKKMVLLVNSDDSARVRIARNIAEDLTELGLPTGTLECKGSNFKNVLVAGTYDIYLGMTRLSPNMDLTAFFSSDGALSWGSLDSVSMYTLCMDSLANHGNFYTLHQNEMDDGRLCPILFSLLADNVQLVQGLLRSCLATHAFYAVSQNLQYWIPKG